MNNKEFLTVSEVNSYIKTYLENNYFLRDIYVRGEISNFKRHQSGTLYFSIKDNNSRINIVMFANFAKNISSNLKDGALVLIKGRLSVYEAGGSYQIQAYEMLFDSIGELYQKFEKLKKQLELEGLFDSKFKKELPKYPKIIGIITAPYGAAIHDMVNTINNRWPLSQIILFPSLVQGSKASEDIVKNIKLADSFGVDVIICGRGGGSIEDLWPFNEENVARAIFNCKTPIISAVGHQSDFTIADFVADARGLTPTDGAMKATPLLKVELENVIKLKDKLIQTFKSIININKQKLINQKNSYVLNHPEKLYEVYRIKLDNLTTSLNNLLINKVNQDKLTIINYKDSLKTLFENVYKLKLNKLSNLASTLDALSPLKILKRGYGVVLKENKTIKSVNDLKKDEIIKTKLSDGTIISKVIETEE